MRLNEPEISKIPDGMQRGFFRGCPGCVRRSRPCNAESCIYISALYGCRVWSELEQTFLERRRKIGTHIPKAATDERYICVNKFKSETFINTARVTCTKKYE